MIVTSLFFCVIIVYAVMILWIANGFSRVPHFFGSDKRPEIKFSVVVPFRNEAENLPTLLHSFSQLNYSRSNFEIIFVDDDSTDDSVEIIRKFPALSFPYSIIKNERKSSSPKKDAISAAISVANFEWIVTTDADCYVPQNWLNLYNDFILDNNPEMVCGPVSMISGDNFLEHFQQLDFLSLQGSTIGAFGIGKPFMCNGANFAYTKNLFLRLNAFSGNDSVASGDDVFLLQKALSGEEESVKVMYLKSDEAIVLTQPEKSWKSFFHQRIRWASKTSSYKNSFSKVLAVVVFAGNLAIVLSFFLTLFSLFSFWNWYLLFALKIFADFFILNQSGKFFKPEKIKFYLISNLFYPFWCVAVAVFSLFGTYSWKGRKF